MFSKRSLSALSRSERHALHCQWLRNGRCARCFHSSLRRRADEEAKNGGNDQGTPINAPQRGPTRHQRSALISKEVQMLQRDRPDPTFNNPDLNTLRPPGAGQTVDPEAVGLNVGGGRMGENDAAAQEGPMARAQRTTLRGGRTDVDAGADTRAARSTGVRSTGQPVTVEDSAERAGSGLEQGLGESSGQRLTRPPNEEEDEDEEQDEEDEDDEDDIPDAWTQRQVAFHPNSTLSRNELLHKYSGSTIAASNYEGIMEDRIRAIAEPGESHQDDTPKSRRLQNLARKLTNSKLVRFTSQEEKAAVLQTARDFARRKPGSSSKSRSKSKPHSSEQIEDQQDSESPGTVQAPSKTYKFAPLPGNVQSAMIEKMVKGTYDPVGVLSGAGNGHVGQRQLLLNGIARATMMNGTYLTGDGERLLQKVKALLPAERAQTQQPQRRKGTA